MSNHYDDYDYSHQANTTARPNPQTFYTRLPEELRREADEINTRMEKEFDVWKESTQSWEQLGRIRDEDFDHIMEALGRWAIPHFDTLIRTVNGTITAALTITPNWLVRRVAAGIFRQVYQEDAGRAQRILNSLSIPLETAPLIPDSIRNLQSVIVNALRDEMYGATPPEPDNLEQE